MNNLILKILPIIEKSTEVFTKDRNERHEIINTVILKCYDNKRIVKQLVESGKINGWVFIVCRNHFLDLKKGHQKTSELESDLIDLNDIIFSERFEKIRTHLEHIENRWIDAYVECGCCFEEMELRFNISRQTCSRRIKSIIEKCKRLNCIL